VYPKKEQVIIQGKENMAGYRFALKIMEKTFCKTCGVQVSNSAIDLTEEELANLEEKNRGFYNYAHKISPLNLRVLNDFHYTDAKESNKMEGASFGSEKYVNP
jgi:hypothetical protein